MAAGGREAEGRLETMAKPNKRYWRVYTRKGSEDPYFHTNIPINCITENNLKELLRCLAAKTSCTEQQIVQAYVKRGTKLARDILIVQRSLGHYYCVEDQLWVGADIVDENDKAVPYYPKWWPQGK